MCDCDYDENDHDVHESDHDRGYAHDSEHEGYHDPDHDHVDARFLGEMAPEGPPCSHLDSSNWLH